jgi:phosphoribosylanthranilate isomerase
MTQIKICGAQNIDTLKTCINVKVNFVGFVFYTASVRAVTTEQIKPFINIIPPEIKKVGLFVNPTNEELQRTLSTLPLDFIQLHGSESYDRVKFIKSNFDLPIIKAIPISTKDDLIQIKEYESVADWILCDAKSTTPISGGNGLTFDWQLLKNYIFQKPWMLSGGLNTTNVDEAISLLNPTALDVSSGVESERGIKSAEKIKDFVKQVRYK